MRRLPSLRKRREGDERYQKSCDPICRCPSHDDYGVTLKLLPAGLVPAGVEINTGAGPGYRFPGTVMTTAFLLQDPTLGGWLPIVTVLPFT